MVAPTEQYLFRCDLALDGIAAGGKDAGCGRDLDADGNRLLAHCQVQALAVDLRHNAVGVQLFDLIRRAVERDAADKAGEYLQLIVAGYIDGADVRYIQLGGAHLGGVKVQRHIGHTVQRNDAGRQLDQPLVVAARLKLAGKVKI